MNRMDQTLFRKYAMEGSEPVLVAFCASWCGYCRRITPALKRLAEQLGRSREAKSIPRNDAQMEAFRTMVREPATVPEQVDGLQQSDDILRLLPPELATLGITELEYEFYRRLVEKQLLNKPKLLQVNP